MTPITKLNNKLRASISSSFNELDSTSIDAAVYGLFVESKNFFEERRRLDLYVDYMDVVDKTVRIGWAQGRSDDDIFNAIDLITNRTINPLLNGIDPKKLGGVIHGT